MNKRVLSILSGVVFGCITFHFLNKSIPDRISISSMADAVVACVSSYPWECDGFTRLMNAARNGNIEDAMKFIAEGDPLDILSNDKDQSSASSNDHFKGVDGRPLRNSALHIAIYNTNFVSNFSIANMLINAGANVRIANASGDTPMHYIMQRIYRKGVFDQTHTNQRDTAYANDISGARTINNNGNPTSNPNALASLSEREDLMINLIAHGADVNAQNNQGYSMLHIGILDNEGQWIQMLTERYGSIVDFNLKAYPESCKNLTEVLGMPPTNSNSTCECLTPIELAGLEAGKCTGNTNLRDYLRNNPPKILGANERDVMGMTGFMLAVIWEGSHKLKDPNYIPTDAHKNFTVDALLPAADLNASVACTTSICSSRLALGNTVLHIALLHQLPDMVIKLLNSGKPMNVNKQNAVHARGPLSIEDPLSYARGGDAPLHYVVKLNELKLPVGAKASNLNTYNKENRQQVVDALIKAGANINIRNANNDTLLHLAVRTGEIDLIKYLLQKYNTPETKKGQLINLSLRNNDGVSQGNTGKTAQQLALELGTKAHASKNDLLASQYQNIVNILQAAQPENEKLLAAAK